jgi:pimeloyl-ACP methyl ester carboxylesterase
MKSQDRSWYEHLRDSVLQANNKGEIKKLNTISNSYPNIDSESYVKDTKLLSSLDFKHGFKASNWLKIYLKSPVMTLRDGIQMLRATSNNENLIKDVLHGYSVLDIVKYKIPVHYILGRHDELTSGVIAAKYFETIEAPQKGLHWIENAGHMPDTDNPSAFFSAIHKIITGL